MNKYKGVVCMASNQYMKSVIRNETIDLIVTSPPYWTIKDYDVKGQIGYGQTLEEYYSSLAKVWKDSYDLLRPGRRLVINVGDQFLRATKKEPYRIEPIHARVITQCVDVGFDYMGAIIWQKRTTKNTSGGGSVMGSYPYPPNGIVELDYEYILIFRKPGKMAKGSVSKKQKEMSALSRDDWMKFFQGHWVFPGARQNEHVAMFPYELPMRIIMMFSFVDETVLDPFLGSGTTMQAALSLGRRAYGFEINPEFEGIIRKKLNMENDLFVSKKRIIFIKPD